MIRPIGTAPSFKAIYTDRNCNFNSNQQETIDNIIGQLRSDSNKDELGRTLEKKYENQGCDFHFTQSTKGRDYVYLEFLIGAKPCDENAVASKKVPGWMTHIGNFSKENIGNLKHALEARDMKVQEDADFLKGVFMTILGIIGISAALILGQKSCSRNSHPVQEQVTKTITMVKDSIAKELPNFKNAEQAQEILGLRLLI